jgi:hypothetical protein
MFPVAFIMPFKVIVPRNRNASWSAVRAVTMSSDTVSHFEGFSWTTFADEVAMKGRRGPFVDPGRFRNRSKTRESTSKYCHGLRATSGVPEPRRSAFGARVAKDLSRSVTRAWSASLCERHYHDEPKRRWDAPPVYVRADERPGSGSYGRRFCGLFLDELEVRDSPRYPQTGCFTALDRADCA